LLNILELLKNLKSKEKTLVKALSQRKNLFQQLYDKSKKKYLKIHE